MKEHLWTLGGYIFKRRPIIGFVWVVPVFPVRYTSLVVFTSMN